MIEHVEARSEDKKKPQRQRASDASVFGTIDDKHVLAKPFGVVTTALHTKSL